MTGAIGIIGVGAIAAAIVDGLCSQPSDAPELFLSPRNATTASELAQKHSTVHICADNQTVVDNAPLVILTVRSDDVRDALADVRMPRDRIVVSAVAGVSRESLRRHVGDHVTIVRAIPLPAVRQRQGITAIYPAHPTVEGLFDRLGGTLAMPDSAIFAALWSTTGTIAAHLHYLDTIAGWAVHHGVDPTEVDRYVRSMFLGVGGTLTDRRRSLSELAAAHETPGGINQQLRTSWLDQGNTAALRRALDDIYKRLTQDP
ncbi:NAD(P)-binding domain-containing protein [Saccharopolyspora sp. NPDC050389]|uniref:NAD(P)-binding domain-containing protein n=1 Tax=Saccharopolyspora sp. NPDC050389 TaxID=3155516 RepID=UPI0033CB5D76